MKKLAKMLAAAAVGAVTLAAPAGAHVWNIGWKSENGGLTFYGVSDSGSVGFYDDFNTYPAGFVINWTNLSFEVDSAVGLGNCVGAGGLTTGSCDGTWNDLELDGAVMSYESPTNTYGKFATATIDASELATYGLVSGKTNSVKLTTYANNVDWAGRSFFTASVPLNIQISAVPLPAALPLAGAGLGLLGLMGWRRRKAA